MLAACVLVSTSAVLAGLVLLRARLAQIAAVFLVGAGLAGLMAVWAAGPADADDLAAVLLIVAGLLLAPAACWAYPRPRWHTSMDVVLTVLLLGPGVVALTRFRDTTVVGTMALLAMSALLAQTWWRLERSESVERRALMWFGVAAGASGFLALVLLFVREGESPGLVGSVGVALLAVVPAAMVIGVLRPDLVDVRGLVVYAVMLAVATTAFVAYYVGVYGVLEEVSGEPPSPGVQAVVALIGAAGLYPAASVLRGVIDRLLFGDRPDALRAATSVLDHFGADPEVALTAIRVSLVLPFAQLVVDGEVVATSGAEVAASRSVPLSLADGTEGELVVGLRSGDLRLSPPDEQVLRLVAPLLAVSVRARALAADLRHSRGQAIAAIEDERRRLRRDLHDGLGPTLSGIAFSADAARNSIRVDPDAAETVLTNLRADAADAVESIRRLVYGIRPPALDELGLEGALRQQAATLRREDGRAVPVAFDVTGRLTELPAAVEVAAYHIVTEALTNVARHSGGNAAAVELALEPGDLLVRVTDNGHTTGPWPAGVGASSMRERAAEVGGAVTWGPTASGGQVLATLPLPARKM